MRIPALLAVLGGCSFQLAPGAMPGDARRDGVDDPTDAPADAAIDAAPRFRKRITITSGSPTALTDFPVSVVLAADAQLAARAQDSGLDLAFTTLGGNPLSHELVAFDGTSGALEAWVRIPSMTATTEIYLVYGGALAPVSSSAAWATSTFAGVWHLAEASAMWKDSASTHPVQPVTPAMTPAVATGIIGSARQFDGTDDTSSAGDPVDGSLDFSTSSFSVGVWVYVTQSANPYDMVIDKGGDTNIPGYCLTLGTNNWLVELSDGPNVPTARFGTETTLLNRWNHLVAVIDRTTGNVRAFTNGVLAQETAIPTLGSLAATTGFSIGSPTVAYSFRGIADEVRLYKTALSADWIAAEHRNATARAAFMMVGAEETF